MPNFGATEDLVKEAYGPLADHPNVQSMLATWLIATDLMNKATPGEARDAAVAATIEDLTAFDASVSRLRARAEAAVANTQDDDETTRIRRAAIAPDTLATMRSAQFAIHPTIVLAALH